MTKSGPAALRILGTGVLGGVALALGLLLLSLAVPVNQRSLYVGMGLSVTAFTLVGLIAAGRVLWTSRRRSP